jgi:predicted DNA-binding transcriptional regulator AlpA
LSDEVLSAFLPANRVWSRYGVTSMTLHRWLRDDRLHFPKPMLIGRMRFWRIADLEAWEAERSARSAA